MHIVKIKNIPKSFILFDESALSKATSLESVVFDKDSCLKEITWYVSELKGIWVFHYYEHYHGNNIQRSWEYKSSCACN